MQRGLVHRHFDQCAGDIAKGLAAIVAADDAADFYGDIEIIGLAGVYRDTNRARVKTLALAVRGRDRLWQTLPVVAAIHAAVHRHRRRARIDDIRLGGVHAHTPDHRVFVREIELLPARAAINAAIRAILRADEQDVAVGGVNRNRAHLHFIRQAIVDGLPLAFAGVAEKQTTAIHALRFTFATACARENFGDRHDA